MLGISWGLGSILGPLIGGGFAASSASWRWAFYINLPLAAVMLPIHIFLLPLYNPRPSVPGITKLLQIDWLGATLNAVVFTLFVVVLTLGGSTWSWKSAGPIALWIIFGLSLILYVLQQAFAIGTSPQRRLFPIQFLRSRTMILLYTGTSAAITGLVVPIYYLPLFFQFTRGDSAIQAAVRLLPFICTFFFFIMLTGLLLPILGRYNIFYVVAGAFYIAGGALMHTVKVDTSTATIYGFSVVAAVGAGMILQTGYDIASAKVKTGDEQAAVGFINVAQIGSAAICLAIAGSLFQNIGYINLKHTLAPYGLSEEQIRGALSGASFPTGDAVIQEKAIAAIVETIGTMWILVITAGAVSLVSGLLMRREKIDLSAMEIRVLG
jgi:MFS family permease